MLPGGGGSGGAWSEESKDQNWQGEEGVVLQKGFLPPPPPQRAGLKGDRRYRLSRKGLAAFTEHIQGWVELPHLTSRAPRIPSHAVPACVSPVMGAAFPNARCRPGGFAYRSEIQKGHGVLRFARQFAAPFFFELALFQL